MPFIIVNGEFIFKEDNDFTLPGQGYGTGQGLFETMKVMNGKIFLEQLHFDRLYSGIKLLDYPIPSFLQQLTCKEQIISLCSENHLSLARVRLSISPGSNDDSLKVIMSTLKLKPSNNEFNEEGYRIELFPNGRKELNRFSNLKSSNVDIYADAAEFARSHQLDDCIVLNTEGKVADSSIANIFMFKNTRIKTPDLSQGCVGGVMRNYLVEKLRETGYELHEEAITEEELLDADEVFLTNAIRGIRWVKHFGGATYSNQLTKDIYNRFVKILFN